MTTQLIKMVTPWKNCGERCEHCHKTIEPGQRVVFTMGRTPELYWHAGECFDLGVKPFDLKMVTGPGKGYETPPKIIIRS